MIPPPPRPTPAPMMMSGSLYGIIATGILLVLMLPVIVAMGVWK